MLMMDKNNLQVAALIQDWLAKQGLVAEARLGKDVRADRIGDGRLCANSLLCARRWGADDRRGEFHDGPAGVGALTCG